MASDSGVGIEELESGRRVLRQVSLELGGDCLQGGGGNGARGGEDEGDAARRRGIENRDVDAQRCIAGIRTAPGVVLVAPRSQERAQQDAPADRGAAGGDRGGAPGAGAVPAGATGLL